MVRLRIAANAPYPEEPIDQRAEFMTDPILSLRDARLTLAGNAGPVEILRGITLDVARGQTLGLVGPSGSGKSSLLMLMGGLERATGGQVLALGQDLTAMDEDQLGAVPAGEYGGGVPVLPPDSDDDRAGERGGAAGTGRGARRLRAGRGGIAAVGLGARIDHYPSQMSGGEQQRVALARAAAPRPAILLADEPTGNLDGANGAAIMDLLFGLRDRHGATLVLVTHAPELAARCDRVVRLADGRVHADERRAA
jgi:putative ABC transport system ATP-binding protein